MVRGGVKGEEKGERKLYERSRTLRQRNPPAAAARISGASINAAERIEFEMGRTDDAPALKLDVKCEM